jgi:hypothetical protein
LSSEFLGKTIFQNFFRPKFPFYPTFLGQKFPGKIPWIFPPKKLHEKSAPERIDARVQRNGSTYTQREM